MAVTTNQICLLRNLLLEGLLRSGFRPIRYFDKLLTSRWRMMNIIVYNGGICIDQWMLGIGEVWYFSSYTGVFWPTVDISMVDDVYHCIWWWYIRFLVEKSLTRIKCLFACLIACVSARSKEHRIKRGVRLQETTCKKDLRVTKTFLYGSLHSYWIATWFSFS